MGTGCPYFAFRHEALDRECFCIASAKMHVVLLTSTLCSWLTTLCTCWAGLGHEKTISVAQCGFYKPAVCLVHGVAMLPSMQLF